MIPTMDYARWMLADVEHISSCPILKDKERRFLEHMIFRAIPFLERDYVDVTDVCQTLGLPLGPAVRWLKKNKRVEYRVVHKKRLLSVDSVPMWIFLYIDPHKVKDHYKPFIHELHDEIDRRLELPENKRIMRGFLREIGVNIPDPGPALACDAEHPEDVEVVSRGPFTIRIPKHRK